MAYKPQVLLVPEGGTGDISFTTYAVICGGTTATGALQSIASVGTSGQVLTSNDASALPTFQSAPYAGTGYVLNMAAVNSANPIDNEVDYLNNNQFNAVGSETLPTVIKGRMIIPKAGTITKVYGSVTVAGTKSSASSTTVALLVNGSSVATITSSLQLTAASNTYSNTGLSASVSAGDFVSIRFTNPAWATNPTTVLFCGSIYVS